MAKYCRFSSKESTVLAFDLDACAPRLLRLPLHLLLLHKEDPDDANDNDDDEWEIVLLVLVLLSPSERFPLLLLRAR